jgi:2'-5' RNA ligase/phage portal protein BeeE
MPNLAYVVDAPKPGLTVKACQRAFHNLTNGSFGGSATFGGSGAIVDYTGNNWNPDKPLNRGDLSFSSGGHSFLTIGEYRSKALSVIKPHEELEPLEADHHLRRLLENPNKYDTTFDLFYEAQMFDELCGVDYIWMVPNDFGVPCELWVIPSHWVWPKTGGGQYVDVYNPHADELIQYYEVRPWGGMGSAGILYLPPDQVLCTRWKSPINKIDGYSKLAAGARWIDSEESITNSRWSQFQNVARPEFWVELGPGYEDPDDDRISRIEAKFASKIQGEFNYGKPVITPPGAKITPLSFNPAEMAYVGSEEQIRDMILSLFAVPKAAVGIAEGMTYGSVLAVLATLCSQCLNPRLLMRGQALTKHLGSRWSTPGRSVRIWYDDCVPADPAQVNADLQADERFLAVTPNEVRALRGRKPYEYGGDDPFYSGKPVPINTGEDLSRFNRLVNPPKLKPEDKIPTPGEPTGGGGFGGAIPGVEGGEGVPLGPEGSGELEENQEPIEAGGATTAPYNNPAEEGGIQVPNGRPQRSLEREVTKEVEDEEWKALETPCQTSGAQFHTEIRDNKVSISVDLPEEVEIDEEDSELVEANLHNAVELVLAPYFKKSIEKSENPIELEWEEVGSDWIDSSGVFKLDWIIDLNDPMDNAEYKLLVNGDETEFEGTEEECKTEAQRLANDRYQASMPDWKEEVDPEDYYALGNGKQVEKASRHPDLEIEWIEDCKMRGITLNNNLWEGKVGDNIWCYIIQYRGGDWTIFDSDSGARLTDESFVTSGEAKKRAQVILDNMILGTKEAQEAVDEYHPESEPEDYYRLSANKIVEKSKHKYSSTQFNIEDTDPYLSDDILELAERVDKEDLSDKGREEIPHITVKYGIHTQDATEVRNLVQGFGPIKVRLGKTSLFTQDDTDQDYEVVKIGIVSQDLRRLNKLISDNLDCTDTHPKYNPHITLAYVKVGTGVNYKGWKDLEGKELTLNSLVFSDKEGNLTRINLYRVNKEVTKEKSRYNRGSRLRSYLNPNGTKNGLSSDSR